MDNQTSRFRLLMLLLTALNLGGCLASFYFGTTFPSRLSATTEFLLALGFAVLGVVTVVIGIILVILSLTHRISRSAVWGVLLAVVGLFVALGLLGDASLINSCRIHSPCF